MGVQDGPDRPGGATPAKRLGRRGALKLLGATLSGVAISGRELPAASPAPAAARSAGSIAARLRPLATGTTPASFSPDEFGVLTRVVDLIIPGTETPGAAAAGVHWYLDDAARTDQELRRQLADGLRRLDARAVRECAHRFAELPSSTQVQLLSAIDDMPDPRSAAATSEERHFFALLKSRVIDAYYKSEIGQLGELQWVGHEFYDEFPGACTHPDPTTHPRPTWPRARS